MGDATFMWSAALMGHATTCPVRNAGVWIMGQAEKLAFEVLELGFKILEAAARLCIFALESCSRWRIG